MWKNKRRESRHWLNRALWAVDRNASIVRQLTYAFLLLCSLNPIILLTIRSLYYVQYPETFCDSIGVFVEGNATCETNADNALLFLPEITVSGHLCKGRLTSSYYLPPLLSVWASESPDVSVSTVSLSARRETY
jgi:hypothetical protein